MKYLISLLAISCVTSCFMLPLSHAQELGTVTGRVTSAESGGALADVSVLLEGIGLGDATTLNGTYAIGQVPAGTYVLTVRLLGYAPVQQNVTVTGGETVRADAQLTPAAINLQEVLALADRPYSAASSRRVRAFDLLTRPVRTSQDLLQLAPGLITAQHAGGGKAEQIFLRGFDADHGTDINISVDGMPVNMVSHGHGQGYADLHFLLPEVVDRIDVTKGPYDPQYGNLSTAGAIAFTTKDHLQHNAIRVEGGAFNTASLTALYQIDLPDAAHQGAYVAGQFYNTDGPVDRGQDFQRFNLFGKFHTHLSETTRLSLTASGFSSAWDASGQIPQRAVDQGLINRFGSLDDLEGGTTGRQDLNLIYKADQGDQDFSIQAYASRYTFKLFSNFTFFLDDPELGDMIEQTDNRQIIGVNAKYTVGHALGAVPATATLGGGFRSDDIELSLWRSPDRVRLETLVDAAITERNFYLWAQEEVVVSSLLRFQLGLRGDYFTFDVNDELDGVPAELPHASGYAQQAILSPKASVVVSPRQHVDLYANFGTSFHSNDARNIILEQRINDLARGYRQDGLTEAEIDARLAAQNFDPGQRNVGTLPMAIGTELGLRTDLTKYLHVVAAAWLLDLDREYVYVGDGGFTELSGRTRRYGLDVETRATLTPWLSADADLNLSRGFFRDEPDEADSIPLAPRLTSTGGITVLHPKGYEGSLRYVHVGDRPANEAGTVTAEGFTLFNLLAAYRFGSVKVNAVLENIFDVDWNEAQFDTESRLRGEVAPVSELHFTPGNPRNVRLGVSYLF